MVVFAFTALASCTDSGDNSASSSASESVESGSESKSPEVEITVEMAATLTVNLFNSGKVTATANSEEKIVYSVDDETVLTVDKESGAITPLKAGKAKITATVEGKTAECEVTVVAPAEDALSVVAISRTLNIKTTKTAIIEVQSFMDEEELANVTYTFISSAPAVASVDEKGVVTGLGKGTAEITVTGTLKGVKLGTDVVTVNVTESVAVTADKEKVTLYTAAGEDAENPLMTEIALNVEVEVNDEKVENPEISVVSSDEEVVKYENGKLVAKGKKGTATVTVSYVTALGTEGKATVEVTVLYPIKKISEEDVNIIGLNRGTDLAYAPAFTVVAADKAIIGEDEYPVRVDEGKLVVELNGVKAGEEAHEIVVTVDSENVTYEITLSAVVYDFLIGDKAEFTAFLTALDDARYIYAKLTSNVNLEDTAIATDNNPSDMSGDKRTVSFMLDGNGYTVIKMSARNVRGAIAERVGKNSVIKNIAFEDCAMRDSAAGGLFVTASDLRLENVYISCSVNYWTGAVVTLFADENVTYKNVVVYVNDISHAGSSAGLSTDTVCYDGSPIGVLSSLGAFNKTKSYENVYAVSDKAQKIVRGLSVTDGEGKETEATPCTYTEGLYADMDAFTAAVKALPEGFDAKMWKINDEGKLVFVTVPEPRRLTVDFAEGKINLEEFGLTPCGTKNGSQLVTEGAPQGAKDSALHVSDTAGWSGLSIKFAEAIDYDEKMSDIIVKVYLSQRTELRFFTLFDERPVTDYAHDYLANVDGGKWYEVRLTASHYVENGKINGFRFCDCTGSEIWIDSVTIVYAD